MQHFAGHGCSDGATPVLDGPTPAILSPRPGQSASVDKARVDAPSVVAGQRDGRGHTWQGGDVGPIADLAAGQALGGAGDDLSRGPIAGALRPAPSIGRQAPLSRLCSRKGANGATFRRVEVGQCDLDAQVDGLTLTVQGLQDIAHARDLRQRGSASDVAESAATVIDHSTA
jgi:hypothetical protein